MACGKGASYSGSEGNFSYSITIGSNGTAFNFNYNAYSFPDRFNVFLPNGTRIFTKMAGTAGNPSRDCTCSKCMSEQTFANGNINLPRPKGVSSVLVIVNGYCPGMTSMHQGVNSGRRVLRPDPGKHANLDPMTHTSTV